MLCHIDDTIMLRWCYGAMSINVPVVFAGEGIQQGNQHFLSLAITTTLAAVGMIISLQLQGQTLVGVWCSLTIFYAIRLLSVLRHHFISGPLSASKLEERYIVAKPGPTTTGPPAAAFAI